MKFSLFLIVAFCGLISAENVVVSFEDFIQEELSAEEVDVFNPIFETLRSEYEEALSQNNNQTEEGVLMFNILQKELEKQTYLEEKHLVFKYNINLPTSTELLVGQDPTDPIYEDVKTELDEILINAEETITELVLRANEAENELTRGSQISIVKILVKLLVKLLRVIGTVIRAAYCTYTHIQDITYTIKDVQYKTKQCANYTLEAISNLHQDVQQSIDEVIFSVTHMGKMVNHAMGRKTVIGKIFALMFNVGRMYDEIGNARKSATEALTTVKSSAPEIIVMTKKCEVKAIKDTIHEVNESLIGIKKCVNKN